MSETLTVLQTADGAARRPPVGWARRTGWIGAGIAVLVLACLASVAFGTRVVGWAELVETFTGEANDLTQAAVRARVPRTVLAVLVGAALGLAGVMLQGVTRNPLADPALMGITPGAGLAVVTGIAFFGLRSPTGYLWVAILGAALAALFVWMIGATGRTGPTPLKLALAGAASAAASTSLISAILLPRIDVLNVFRFWQIGGVGGGSERIVPVLPFLAAGAVISLCCARALDSLALGDDVAAGLGERVVRTRLVAAAGAVTLCGAATAVAGPIAFVGLVVPHLCRLLIGVEHRWLAPFSAIVGAALLTAADVAGRVVARPEEIDVGIMTALLGAPVFVAIVRRQKLREL